MLLNYSLIITPKKKLFSYNALKILSFQLKFSHFLTLFFQYEKCNFKLLVEVFGNSIKNFAEEENSCLLFEEGFSFLQTKTYR